MEAPMKPKPQDRDAFDLFQSHFDQLLNPKHELVQLAKKIDWSRFETALASCYTEDMGAPAKATRLMVGLQYLKYTFNESDESVVARWVENPYWQYFCGFTHMQHEVPLDASSMSRWRKRVGAERLELLLQETIDLAVREKHVSKGELERVNVDTTVQEKNIAYPTDSKLLYKAIEKLGDAAKSRAIPLRQSYIRVGKRAAVKASRYAHAKHYKRMRRCLRKLRTYVGRLIRDIRRKANEPEPELAALLDRAERIRQQQPHDTHKLYSLHEPEVQCISKGKAHKRYEFGQKVAIATTNRGNWTVAAKLLPGNPYDGHTLAETLTTIERITGVTVTDAYVDKGYRGHGCTGAVNVHVAGQRSSARSVAPKNGTQESANQVAPKGETSDGANEWASKSETRAVRDGARGVGDHRNGNARRQTRATRSERKRRRRRSAIEPKIGHLKSDHRMDRCFLAGLEGDATNALLAAAGSNLRKLLNRIRNNAGRLAAALILRWATLLQGVARPIMCFRRIPQLRPNALAA
jgi:IS5 family transposase